MSREDQNFGTHSHLQRTFTRRDLLIAAVAGAAVGAEAFNLGEGLFSSKTSKHSAESSPQIPDTLLKKYGFALLDLRESVLSGSGDPINNLTSHSATDALRFLAELKPPTIHEVTLSQIPTVNVNKTATVTVRPAAKPLQEGISMIAFDPGSIAFYTLPANLNPDTARVYALYVNDAPKAEEMTVSYTPYGKVFFISDFHRVIQSGGRDITATPTPCQPQASSIDKGILLLVVK